MGKESVAIGIEAERLARLYLEKRGLKCLECNYSCKMGELDLIMLDGKYRVFVEVRKRRYDTFGSGLESITPHKIRCLYRAATHYLLGKNLYDKVDCRFDIISMDKFDDIEWIKNAFELVY